MSNKEFQRVKVEVGSKGSERFRMLRLKMAVIIFIKFIT